MSISMEQEHQKDQYFMSPHWLSNLVSYQADLIHNSVLSLFSLLSSLFSPSYHESEETNVESAVQNAPSQLLKKLGLCLLSIAYVCMVLILVLLVASLVGFCLVRWWVEEPLVVEEPLHFDYTDSHPSALFLFHGVSVVDGHVKKKHLSVPLGHTFSVSVLLVMPESDFNRDLGVFQLSAELLSANGNVIAKSSQPCMLRFRSSPIRLARTVMMGLPLVLGISGETQNINVEILKHKEENRRTNAIRITLHPRAGTSSLPQIYEAEIMVKSSLPWAKELVRNWKWTFYVWVSLYVYIMLLMLLLCFYRPLIFLEMTPELFNDQNRASELTSEEQKELRVRELLGDESDVSELLRKWRSSRSKRKSIMAHGGGDGVPETTIGSSASSISMTTREDVTSVVVEEEVEATREDVTSVVVEEEVEDSESVCIS